MARAYPHEGGWYRPSFGAPIATHWRPSSPATGCRVTSGSTRTTIPSPTSISSLAEAQASRSLDVDVDLLLVRLRLVVLEAFGARRQVEVVDAERGHAQRPPQLLDHSVELVQPGHVVSRHVPSVRFSAAYRASIVVPSAPTRHPRICRPRPRRLRQRRATTALLRRPARRRSPARRRRQQAAGEQFGYIRSVSTAGPAATLAFDEAEFLTGEEAQRAAEEDGAVPAGRAGARTTTTSGTPTSRRRRSRSRRTPRSRPVAARSAATASPATSRTSSASFMKKGQTYADPYRGAESLYWLTIEDGTVVAIDEQYVPVARATSGRCRTSSRGSARSAPPRSRARARAACRAGR